MATNNRDVKMTLSVETLGAEDIKKLQASVLSLAKEAGDAAPEFEKLAAEIGQLGSQADALRSFETLAAKVTEAAQAQEQAAAKAAELKAKYDQLQGSTDEARARQEAVTKEWLKASGSLDKLVAELKSLKTTTDDSAKSEEDFKQKISKNIAAQAALKARVRELNVERIEAGKTLDKTAAAEDRASKAWLTAADAAERNQRALAAQQTELKKLGDELDALGLSSQNVAASQAQLLQAVNATGRAAQQAAELSRQAAELDRESAEAKNQLAAAARAQAAAAEESARRRVAAEAEVDRAQEEILQRTLAVENRKNEIRERTADLQRQRANRQTADDIALLKQQYAAEEAASERIIAMKKAAYDRIAALARENAQKTEAAARQSAQALADAFGSIGIRNVQDVNAEIEQVRRSMQLVAQQSGLTGSALAEAMNRGGARINELQREMRELTGQLTLADRAADLFKNSIGQIAAGNLIADAIGSLVEKVKEMGRQFVLVNVQAQQMQRGLTAVYGDAKIAEQQIAFLNRTASSAGVSIAQLGDSFVRFSAATQSSNIPLEQTNALFNAVVRAGSTLGLTTERVQLALDALGQIASKGVVSMEELRQQLGDSLPGALSLTAKGLGVTDAELIKLVESGRLASRDFFPALTNGLKNLQGEATGLAVEWARFKNLLTQTATEAGKGGGIDVLTGAMKALTAVVGPLVTIVGTLFEGLTLLGRTLGTVAAAAVTLTNPMSELGRIWTESANRVDAYADRMNVALGRMSEAEAAARAQARARTEERVATEGAAKAVEVSTKNYVEAASAAAQYGGATNAIKVASDELKKANGDLTKAYIGVGKELTRLAGQQADDVVIKTKGVKAAELQAQALEDEAKARGTANDKLSAAVRGNQLVIDATAAEAKARQQLASTLAIELSTKLQLAAQEKNGLASRKAELDLLKEKVEKATAEAAVARESLSAIKAKSAEEERAAKQEIANLKQAAAALAQKNLLLQDNSRNSAVYQQEMQRTAEALEKVRAAAAQGKATTEQLTEAEKAATLAKERYNDAMEDQRAKLEANTKAKSVAKQVDIAGLELALAESKAAEELAARKGDEKRVREELIKQKKIELEIFRLQTEAMRIEAQGSIEVAKAKMAELKALKELTPAKQLELETEIKLAEIKLKQADIRNVVARSTQEGIRAFESSKKALDGEREAVEGNTQSWANNVKEREHALQLAKAAKGEFAYDKEGYRMDANGQRSVYEIPKRVLETNDWLSNMDMRSGLPIMPWNEWLEKKGLLAKSAAPKDASFGNLPTSVREANAARAAQRATQQQKLQEQIASYGPAQTGTPPVMNPVPVPAPATAPRDVPPQRTININFGGRTTAINVASQQDEAALISLLQQLEGAAGRAGG